MKNVLSIILSAFSCILFLNPLSAQTEFGVTGGINFSGMDYTSGIEIIDNSIDEIGDETSAVINGIGSSAYKPGINLGVYMLKESGAFSFNPSIMYSHKGSKTDTYKTNLGYLSAPIMLGVELFDVLHIQAGPQLGFLLTEKVKPEDGDAYELTDFYNKLDFGAALGILVDLPGGLGITGRYIHGLGAVNDPIPVGDKEFKLQNRVFQASVNVPLSRLFSDGE